MCILDLPALELVTKNQIIFPLRITLVEQGWSILPMFISMSKS